MGREEFYHRLLDARLCVITDRSLSRLAGASPSRAAPRDTLSMVRALVKAGAPMIQLREKDVPDAELLGLAREVRHLTRGTKTLFIVNDRPDLAAACDADGVHVGQGDLPVAQARKIVGPYRLVGLSVENVDQAVAALDTDADYLGVGPVYATPTKTDAAPPAGLSIFGELEEKGVRMPAYAIGGVNTGNAARILEAGAWGLAVVSAVAAAPDPGKAVREFLRILDEHPYE